LAAELRNYLLGAGLIFGAFWFRASVNARRPAGMLPPVS
jgi:hypothetical protein